MTKTEILLIKAIVSFDKKSNELIKQMAYEFGLDLAAENPFSKLLTRNNNLWKGLLKGDWTYQFHGDSCKFENTISGQLIDVKINRNGHYGVIDNFYLFEYIKTTSELNYVLKEINSFEIIQKSLLELEKYQIIIRIGQSPFESCILNYEALSKQLQENTL